MKKWHGGSSGDYDEEKNGIQSDRISDAADNSAPGVRKNAGDSMEIDDMELKPKKVMLVNNKFPKQKKKWSVRKKTIVFSIVGVIAAALIFVGVWALVIMSDPLAQFNPDPSQPQTTESQPAEETSYKPGDPTPSPTPDPEEVLLSQADQAMLAQKFVNILLIGVDHSTERDTWSGKKDFHADVMIVLSINKETNKVSMISLPRDTYAKIPGVDGIYKLNASINCGGGWGDSGFQKVCESAEWMLGDVVKLDGYFAVDMNAVKGLVDAIGGVDYDLDISFDNMGREYTKGLQHMDGQAVLDYLRVRKAEHIVDKNQATDSHRVERQKKMLIAIFEKIKSNGLLAGIPNLISAFDGNLEYNLTFNQISALAYYALTNVDTEDINMYSMSGGSRNIFNWNFIITDQTNRLKIIKEVYGVDVSKRSSYMLPAAQKLWGDMQAPYITGVAKPKLDQIKALLDEDFLKPVQPTSPPPSTSETAPSESAGTEPTIAPTVAPTPTAPPGGWRQYGDDVWAFYNQVITEYDKIVNYDSMQSGEELLALEEQFKKDVGTLCGMFKITAPTAKEWRLNYESDPKVNEVKVDFN